MTSWMKNTGRKPKKIKQKKDFDWEKYEMNAQKHMKYNPSVTNRNRRELILPERELKKIKFDKRFDLDKLRQAYVDFYNGKETYSHISRHLGISIYMLKRYFAKITYMMQKAQEEREFEEWKAQRSNSYLRTQSLIDIDTESHKNS